MSYSLLPNTDFNESIIVIKEVNTIYGNGINTGGSRINYAATGDA